MTDEDKSENYFVALKAAENTPAYLARELRLMIAAEKEYAIFAHVGPWIVNVWQAAAAFIEKAAGLPGPENKPDF